MLDGLAPQDASLENAALLTELQVEGDALNLDAPLIVDPVRRVRGGRYPALQALWVLSRDQRGRVGGHLPDASIA